MSLPRLRALYLATGGTDKWLRNGCWLNTSVPVCWWDQVLCNTTTWRVRELRFASNNMHGTIPEEIGLLSHLEVLQLTFNRGLTGTLPPAVGRLSKLKWLYAWNASLQSVPETVGGMQGLVKLDLMDNALAGALPDSLAQLGLTDTAYFDGNDGLTCPVSAAVGKWLQGVKYHAEPCANSTAV